MVKIAPSVLSANFGCLSQEIVDVCQSGADYIHVDVMDGHFVPNLTFGPMITSKIKEIATLPLDVHLMVNEPQKMIDWFVKAGADILTVHYEACPNLAEVIQNIKSCGVKVGVSIKPNTKIEVLEPYLSDLDLILVMSVEPGFGGQKFMPQALEKITWLSEQKQAHDYHFSIEVDGGINEQTSALCISAGADILVAGNYVFKQDDYAQAIRCLKGEVYEEK